MATRLTKNFTLEEMCASTTAKWRGIKNEAPAQAIANLTHVACHILQPLRDAMNEPVKIGSGYRCPALNAIVGGVKNSQHMTGEAVDICIDGDIEKGKRWFRWIKANCEFDQLLFEKNAKGSRWIHVSCSMTNNRMMANENYNA